MSTPSLSVDELIERSHVVSIPLRHRFRGIDYRETMIIEGDRGPAEWAAFVEYGDDEAAWWLASAIEQGFATDLPSLPGGVKNVPINAIIPAIDPSEIPALLRKFPGVASIKLKVGEPGHTPIDDVSRLSKIRDLVGPDVAIRLDANAAWQVAEAERNIFMFSAFGIDYVEQPVATIDQMVNVRQRLEGTGIFLAADESLRKGHALDEILDRQAAHLLILKVNPLGGIMKSLEIARKARDRGVGVVVSSGLETSVGLSHGVHLWALLHQVNPEASLDAGLGTLTLFDGDVVTQPLVHDHGSISVAPPVLDPRKLKKYRADQERTLWWQDRFRRVYRLLDQVA
jgi:o-succinylbenzoate synthase